jgi:hypothetical protein
VAAAEQGDVHGRIDQVSLDLSKRALAVVLQRTAGERS